MIHEPGSKAIQTYQMSFRTPQSIEVLFMIQGSVVRAFISKEGSYVG